MKNLFWDEPYLYHSCADGVICCCVPEVEMSSVLEACHLSPVCGHHSGIHIVHKIFQSGYYWPIIDQDAHDFAMSCESCQRECGISMRKELSMSPIFVIKYRIGWKQLLSQQ